MLAKIFAFTALAVGVFGIPDVTPVPLPPVCSSYPQYDEETNTAGPWLIKLVNSENATIEGFSDTQSISRGPRGIRWGYITFPEINQVAKTPLKCEDDTLKGRVATGVSSVTWEKLNLSPYPYDATLIYLVDGPDVAPFKHVIDGVEQDGVFLGGKDSGVTTWGLRYYPADSGSFGLAYFYIRLLGPGSANPQTGEELYPDEFKSFIAISV